MPKRHRGFQCNDGRSAGEPRHGRGLHPSLDRCVRSGWDPQAKGAPRRASSERPRRAPQSSARVRTAGRAAARSRASPSFARCWQDRRRSHRDTVPGVCGASRRMHVRRDHPPHGRGLRRAHPRPDFPSESRLESTSEPDREVRPRSHRRRARARLASAAGPASGHYTQSGEAPQNGASEPPSPLRYSGGACKSIRLE